MPSYYDSTKKKPGTAKVKYNKGGKVKKMKAGGKSGGGRRGRGGSSADSGKSPFSKIDPGKFTQESIRKFINSVRYTGPDGADISLLVPVKKMKGGGTVARGSGAARPQAFHKNG